MRRSRRLRRVVSLVCALAIAVPLAACSSESTPSVVLPSANPSTLPEAVRTQLSTAVERAMAASGSSGAVAGVWVPWAGTWTVGAGTLKPGGSPVTAGSSVSAGAVTQAMTCDVLFAMVKDGKVGLGDPVTTYVPGLPGYDNVTLGDLCNSTTGLPSFDGPLQARLLANPARVWNPRELIAYGMSGTGVANPGASFADADTNYVLLGVALESASRLSAEALYEKYVFGPTGMTNSSLPVNAASDLRGSWSGTTAEGAVACAEPVDLGTVSPSFQFTAGGVVSDLTDLGRYTQALAMGARPYDTDKRFADPLPAAPDAPSWFTARGGTFQAGTLIGQFGATPGFLTAAFADKNTGMTVVVVLNNSRASATLVRSLAWQLAAIASKLPATGGGTTPDAGLPWTADDMAAQVAAAAICPIP